MRSAVMTVGHGRSQKSAERNPTPFTRPTPPITLSIAAERAKHPFRLRPRLFELSLRDRIRDDSRAGAEPDHVAFDRKRADQDIEIEIAIAVQIAERSRVRAAADAFELGDDL